jgi:hypothetical protein
MLRVVPTKRGCLRRGMRSAVSGPGDRWRTNAERGNRFTSAGFVSIPVEQNARRDVPEDVGGQMPRVARDSSPTGGLPEWTREVPGEVDAVGSDRAA